MSWRHFVNHTVVNKVDIILQHYGRLKGFIYCLVKNIKQRTPERYIQCISFSPDLFNFLLMLNLNEGPVSYSLTVTHKY